MFRSRSKVECVAPQGAKRRKSAAHRQAVGSDRNVPKPRRDGRKTTTQTHRERHRRTPCLRRICTGKLVSASRCWVGGFSVRKRSAQKCLPPACCKVPQINACAAVGTRKVGWSV